MGWEVSEGISAIGCGRAQTAAVIIEIFATFSDAFEMLLLSFIGPLVQCEWHCTRIEEALLTSGVFLGMCFGGIAFSVAGDTACAGRRKSTIWAFFLMFGAGFASAFAPDIWSLIVLRTILGFGIAGSVLIPYVLVVEILPEKNRGAWSSICQLAWALGSLVLVGTAWLVLPLYGWRYLVLACSLPAGLSAMFALCFMPESPHLLAMHGKHEQALEVLESMASMNGNKLPQGELVITHGLSEDPMEISSNATDRLRALFDADSWAMTLKLWLVWFSCSFTYYGTVLVTTEYSKDVAREADCLAPNGDWSDADQAANVFSSHSYKFILSATWGELAAFVFFFLLVERIGRRWLISGSFMIFAASYAVLAVIADSNRDETWTALQAALFFARASSGISFAGIYVYTAEVYRTEQRTMGLAMGFVMARIGGIVTPFIGQALFQTSAAISALVYVAVAVIAAVTCASFSLETTGMKLKH